MFSDDDEHLYCAFEVFYIPLYDMWLHVTNRPSIQLLIAKDTAQLHIPCHCENDGDRFIVLILVVNNIIIQVIMLCRCKSHRSPHHCIYDM